MPVIMNPISEIKTKLGVNPNGPVQNYFTAQCGKRMDKYVPFDNGGLRRYKLSYNYVSYEVPYARYQYKGVREDGTHQINEANRNRSKHPLASSYWDKKMVSAEMTDLEADLQNFIDKRGF